MQRSARTSHADPGIDSSLGLYAIENYALLVGTQALERISYDAPDRRLARVEDWLELLGGFAKRELR